MEHIRKVFFKESKKEQFNIIKSIGLNEEQDIQHKIGFKNILEHLIADYNIDDYNFEVIHSLFNYFTGNIDYCKKNDINLNKGILICGGVGTGKSSLIEAFKLYTGTILMKNSFQYHKASTITDKVNDIGITYFDYFNENRSGINCYPISCYIDDICSKNEKINNYGTKISVIENLIDIRYEIYKKFRKLTHFSSNVYPEQLSYYYDLRVIDRLKEMCNVFELGGESRRA